MRFLIEVTMVKDTHCLPGEMPTVLPPGRVIRNRPVASTTSITGSSSSSSSSSNVDVAGGRNGTTTTSSLHSEQQQQQQQQRQSKRRQRPAVCWMSATSSSCCYSSHKTEFCWRSHVLVAIISSLLTWFVITTATSFSNNTHDNTSINSLLAYHAGKTKNDDDYTRQKLLDQAKPRARSVPRGGQTRIRKSTIPALLSSSSTTTTTTSKSTKTTTTETPSPPLSLTSTVDDMIESNFGGTENLPIRVWNYSKFPCVPSPQSEKLMERTPLAEGFLFQRPMKVGSTSFVGVVLRLVHNRMKAMMKMKAENENQKQQQENDGEDVAANSQFCSYRAMHGSATKMGFDRRSNKGDTSFLMSLVRDPTERAISEFFHFVVSNGQVDPTDHNFQLTLLAPKFRPVASPPYFYNRYLLDMTCRNYHHHDRRHDKNNKNDQNDSNDNIDTISEQRVIQELGITETHLEEAKSSKPQSQNVDHATIMSEMLTIQQFGSATTQINYTQIVDDILQDYDFIGVTERMDESLVVLSYLLDLTLEEILYVKNPRASGGWGTHTRDRPCIYVTPSFVSPGMNEWFNGDDVGGGGGHSSSNTIVQPKPWPEMVYGDTLLHRAVNASLDATIDKLIGLDKFNERLQLYLYMKEKATEFCHAHNMIRPACSDGGTKIPHHENTCYIWGEACDHVCLDSNELNQYLSGLTPGPESAAASDNE